MVLLMIELFLNLDTGEMKISTNTNNGIFVTINPGGGISASHLLNTNKNYMVKRDYHLPVVLDQYWLDTVGLKTRRRINK